MIFCKLEQLGRYRGLSQHLDTAIHFLEEGGASRLTMGRNEVDGEAVYVNRFAYDTAAEAITEGHIRYVVAHMLTCILSFPARSRSAWRMYPPWRRLSGERRRTASFFPAPSRAFAS